MAKSHRAVPAYRPHKPTGQAVIRLNGHDHYLGRHGTPASRAEYDRLIAEWLSNGRQLPPTPTTDADGLDINELIVADLDFAQVYYRKGDQPAPEYDNIRLALRPLQRLYGDTPVASFGPLALKAVRQSMIDAGLARGHINQRIGRIVRLFKWGVENELVSPTVHQALKAVAGLRKGRSNARESKPVKPVADAMVDAVQPFVARQVQAMIQLQRLTVMRSGEVTTMRACDLDMTGRVWVYTPAAHKMDYRDRERKIYLGPQAQAIVCEWLLPELSAYLFDHREAIEEQRQEKRRRRKTPSTPSQRARKPKANPGRALGLVIRSSPTTTPSCAAATVRSPIPLMTGSGRRT
jgi:integrase